MQRGLPRLLLWIGLAFGCCASGCGDGPAPLKLQTPDAMQFTQAVYPVLLRDCSFDTCHGSSERFFQVRGPGRARLLAATRELDPATSEEISFSYDRARSMIDAQASEHSLLLRKPLETAVGGSGHEGVDDLGRNVYQTKQDPGYAALARWVAGRRAGVKP